MLKSTNFNANFVDEDECSSSESNACKQVCVNVPGTYVCQCNDGFRLNDDGRTCAGEITYCIMCLCLQLLTNCILWSYDEMHCGSSYKNSTYHYEK